MLLKDLTRFSQFALGAVLAGGLFSVVTSATAVADEQRRSQHTLACVQEAQEAQPYVLGGFALQEIVDAIRDYDEQFGDSAEGREQLVHMVAMFNKWEEISQTHTQEEFLAEGTCSFTGGFGLISAPAVAEHCSGDRFNFWCASMITEYQFSAPMAQNDPAQLMFGDRDLQCQAYNQEYANLIQAAKESGPEHEARIATLQNDMFIMFERAFQRRLYTNDEEAERTFLNFARRAVELEESRVSLVYGSVEAGMRALMLENTYQWDSCLRTGAGPIPQESDELHKLRFANEMQWCVNASQADERPSNYAQRCEDIVFFENEFIQVCAEAQDTPFCAAYIDD
ncbi:hypothetical protein FM042_03945 [Aliidiomarina halalkaliphila]|uniref:Lysozyme inhibitor LprI N-terminal domain-containing protein n=1 Tax=Aliidiomarina halalkaliphila TaxID=2593535 RepID=A0A552X619_9GAMM|nr:hypothetical protein [Aliidiomarina halalkaliphila]TRW50013.1 hypothetical protein FM042_03945 [Aliidiomarina halalkaliphila]